jgi:uncharacterized Fe-S cluster protein YjdI
MAAKDYARDGLTVHWDAEICMHSGVCVKTLPGVFNPKASPWIDVDGAEVDQIVAAVDACPTGALSYSRPGDVEVEVVGTVTIHPEENGPLRIDGQVNLIDADGNVVRSGERFFLCRCGHSNSKPFCDGSHRKFGFTG